ncbi:HpcH/HpaI aldolase family protein [Paraburkholderia sp. J63]|uniref:HpcH/HpaI aldolase family protein n=1 Tax=Paraburkholderia sp. J63 TaxID=2805434 RepID=UPI002ABD5D7F|nr:aldolase/citrate lyase family protein [Paraburkholderia sp. J63]
MNDYPGIEMNLAQLTRNSVKEKLSAKGTVLSMTVTFGRGSEIARVAKAAGFDSLYVDLEHSTIDLRDAGQICLAAQELGLTPFIRVADWRGADIGRALDAGAMGIIAPHVETAEDAREIVRQARYFPLGERSASPQLPLLGYRQFPVDDVFRAVNDATMVTVMLESERALDNLEAIADVDGVDMVFVGTYDLSMDMGIPGDVCHPRVRSALRHVVETCRRAGKFVGIGGMAGQPDELSIWIAAGAQFISCGTDLGFLIKGSTLAAQRIGEISSKVEQRHE